MCTVVFETASSECARCVYTGPNMCPSLSEYRVKERRGGDVHYSVGPSGTINPAITRHIINIPIDLRKAYTINQHTEQVRTDTRTAR